MKNRLPVLGLIAGIVIAPVGLFMALASGGAGHGHYMAAKVWFPFTMASTYLLGSITPPFIFLAIVQCPIYGLLIGRMFRDRKNALPAITVGILHLVTVLLLCEYPPRYFE